MQCGEGSGDEPLYELLVEIGEPQETSEIFGGVKCGPLCHSSYLGLVHSNTLPIDDILQERDGRDIAFFCFSHRADSPLGGKTLA